MVNTKIRLIIFFAAKDGALYSQQKQDRELTMAQIMNSLLSNSEACQKCKNLQFNLRSTESKSAFYKDPPFLTQGVKAPSQKRGTWSPQVHLCLYIFLGLSSNFP